MAALHGLKGPAAVWAWVRWLERHPGRWAAGDWEIPLAQVGLSFDEAEAIFGGASLAGVRQAAAGLIGAEAVSAAADRRE